MKKLKVKYLNEKEDMASRLVTTEKGRNNIGTVAGFTKAGSKTIKSKVKEKLSLVKTVEGNIFLSGWSMEYYGDQKEESDIRRNNGSL